MKFVAENKVVGIEYLFFFILKVHKAQNCYKIQFDFFFINPKFAPILPSFSIMTITFVFVPLKPRLRHNDAQIF